MALNYKVCVDGAVEISSCDMIVPSTWDSRTYTNGAGCSVLEQTKVCEFTSSVPSDNDFRIFYQYWVDFKTNFEYTTQGQRRIGYVIMPAGATSADLTVYHYIKTTCDNDSDPYAPAGGLPDEL